MHELSVAQAIADNVRRHADGRRVQRASVRIGHLRQVVPDALGFAWEMLTEGTELEGCELEIEHVRAVVACSACGTETELDWPVLGCAACGSTAVDLLSGEEFQLATIDIGEEVA